MNQVRTNPVAIRPAAPSELEWINRRYAEVDFVASSECDMVAVAEVDGAPAGLGRLVAQEDGSAELGGIVVFAGFRGQGLARRIVAYLLDHAKATTLYCLPFAKLAPMYAAAGFAPVVDRDAVPAALADKHAWCNQHYPEPVLLLARRANAASPQANRVRPDTPCVAVCSTLFDEICRGCGRSAMEVANWVCMSQAEKDAVWERITRQGYPRRQG